MLKQRGRKILRERENKRDKGPEMKQERERERGLNEKEAITAESLF